MTDRLRAERWNHNLHYHSVILNAVPDGTTRALDVGCGEGTLARQLETRRTVARVLPGTHYRRHLLWRYSLTWTKPGRRPHSAGSAG